MSRLAEDRIVILATHVVEDISQTCEQIAVLDKGTLVFNGQTRRLIESASGHTWQFLAHPGYIPPAELSVISALSQREGTRYHAVGPEPRGPIQEVQPLLPTLEDGYVWPRQQSLNLP